jgi:hypothetical protein
MTGYISFTNSFKYKFYQTLNFLKLCLLCKMESVNVEVFDLSSRIRCEAFSLNLFPIFKLIYVIWVWAKGHVLIKCSNQDHINKIVCVEAMKCLSYK